MMLSTPITPDGCNHAKAPDCDAQDIPVRKTCREVGRQEVGPGSPDRPVAPQELASQPLRECRSGPKSLQVLSAPSVVRNSPANGVTPTLPEPNVPVEIDPALRLNVWVSE